MELRKPCERSVAPRKRRPRLASVLLVAVLIFMLMLLLLWFVHMPGLSPPAPMPSEPTQASAEAVRQPIDFRMDDFEIGWLAYHDAVMHTEDGGAHWMDADMPAIPAPPAAVPDGMLPWMAGRLPSPDTITVESKQYKVKKAQFLTANVGWALTEAAVQSAQQVPLWVTADGGQTWGHASSAEAVQGLAAERLRMQSIRHEAAYYPDSQTARQAIQSDWMLMPSTAAPGDIILVRHRSPGALEWQGKSYELQTFGAGYFTYLPVPMKTKPGTYAIGDQELTVKDKKFDTQHLKVTKQMESMRQDIQRIQADQKKIDRARSTSMPEFLFSGPFMKPVEGVLTTPFGYTRYVNGRLDSSHMALDLAAKQGTPVKAANDGVVVLAENIYLTGNAVYIDHGMHLFSQYAHLSELRVKAGDRVKQGDIIGLVGSTGFSTGPHLHFTFWAHNVPVNPDLFFDTTPFHWLEAAR
ncbi:M23 family metallopeptidase [Paenibacillus xerothermodurans]|uniref:M23 family peptidase n=1 Tax=Paenibacillus xerothermodurans TaxID=1977292 RepID=A0A2W1ND65_PAEXE|nr:M23 family metallopeptidase [Paenibacillus xerothermodurans]PZE21031.1 M23 family peptidase [Paenibacillus xerothermodurans]